MAMYLYNVLKEKQKLLLKCGADGTSLYVL